MKYNTKKVLILYWLIYKIYHMSALIHRRLQQFIAVAEAGSFRAAANALNMSQPPLSKSIQLLEAELGAALFERLPSGVRLTAAGQSLLKEGKEILQQLNRAERSVRNTAGKRVPLEIGFVSAALSIAIPTLIRELEADGLPQPKLLELTTPEQVEFLSSGELDMGFLHPPAGLPAGLKCRTIASEPLLLALPDGHPLNDKSNITSADLAKERFVMFPEKQGPALYDRIRTALAGKGQLDVVAEAARLHSQLALVSSGLGLGFIGAFSASRLSYRGVKFRQWSDRPAEIELILAVAGRSDLIERYVNNKRGAD